jgi:chemotaxis-related protein WspB
MRCISFQLGEGQYALPLRDLVEVLPLLSMREAPHAPDYISGIINYRGHVVPVLDLCQLALGRPCRERMSTRLLVLRSQLAGRTDRLLALMVERAVSEVQLDPATLKPSPLRIDETPYLKGLAASASGLLQLVDISQLLQEEVAALLYPEEVAQA